MSRLVKLALVLAAWPPTPSCDLCQQSVEQIKARWTGLVPELKQELPALLCSRCPVASTCSQLVDAGLDAVTAELENVTSAQVCEELRLCNGTLFV